MDLENLKKRVEKCFTFEHSLFKIEAFGQDRFFIDLDATCMNELNNFASEFKDDNIVILPGYFRNTSIRMYFCINV